MAWSPTRLVGWTPNAMGLLLLLAVVGCDSKRPPVTRQTQAPAVEFIEAPRPGEAVLEVPAPGRGTLGTAGTRTRLTESPATVDLRLGNVVAAFLDAPDDVDAYRVTAAAEGFLRVEVAPVADAVLLVRAEQGAPTWRSDAGGVGIAEGVTNIPVAPGAYVVERKAYAPKPSKKKAVAKPSHAWPAPYELRVTIEASPVGAEREPNEDRGAAGRMFLGEAAFGVLGWNGDIDTWQVSLEGAGDAQGIRLDVELTGVARGVPSLALLGVDGAPLVRRQGVVGQPLVIEGVNLPAQAAAYVQVQGERASYAQPYQVVVKVRPSQEPGGPAEREPNDLASVATALTLGVGHQGEIAVGDVDCWGLTAEQPRTVAVRLESTGLLTIGVPTAKPPKGTLRELVGQVTATTPLIVCVRGEAALKSNAAYTLTASELDPLPPEDPAGSTP